MQGRTQWWGIVFFLGCMAAGAGSLFIPSVLTHAYNYDAEMRISDSPSGRSFYTGIFTQSIFDEPRVCFEYSQYTDGGRESIDATARLYEVDAAYMLAFLSTDNEGKQLNPNPSLDQYTLITEEDVTFGTSRCQDMPFPTDKPATYAIQAKIGDETITGIIVRSSFGVSAREADSSIVFWAQDYETGKTLSDVDVKVYSPGASPAPVATATPLDDGVMTTPITDQNEIAIASRGDEIALIPLNTQFLSAEYGRYSYMAFNPQDTELSYFAFTDRPVYKPGDTIYFKAVLRNDNDARYSLPSGTARVRISSPGERDPVYDRMIPINVNGEVDGEYQLNDSSPTGTYYLSIQTEPQPEEDSMYHWDADRISFAVEEYRKPEFFLDVTTDRNEYIAGDTISYTASGEYFFGQPLTGVDLELTFTSGDRYMPLFYRDESDWEDRVIRYGSWGSVEEKKDTVPLDNNGTYTDTYQIPKTSVKEKNSHRVQGISASYTDETGVANRARKNVLVYGGEFSIFRTDSYTWSYTIGEPLSIPVLLVPHTETSLANRELSVTIENTHWIKDPNQENPKRMSYTEVNRTLDPLAVTTDATGAATVTFTPEFPGHYELLVQGDDDRGNEVHRTLTLYVREDGSSTDIIGERDEFAVSLDKSRYTPGETARVTINGSLPDRDVFVSVQRGFMDRYYITSLNGTSATLDIPILPQDMPNTYVFVSGMSTNEFSRSYVKVPVSADSQKIDVGVTPDAPNAGPGQTAQVTVTTTDSEGNPVPASATVWVVDKAVFELVSGKPEAYLDIFEGFWHERGFSTSASNSLVDISTWTAGGAGGCFAPGTPVLMGDGSTKPIEEVAVGDTVLTRASESDPTLVSAPVTGTHSAASDGYLIINKNLRITPNHKLFVNGIWQTASQIKLEDTLVDTEGETIVVESVEWLRDPGTVYNLEVETYQTYFADGVWVHNQKGDGIRTEIRDTAYWNPSVQTDENGEATVTFELPDNLTTWVVAAVSSTVDTKAGFSTGEITVSKSAIIRPIQPAVLRVGDTVRLGAVLHNYTEAAYPFTATLAYDGYNLPEATQEAGVIEPNQTAMVNWDVVPDESQDTAVLTYSLSTNETEDLSDAIQQSLPVEKPGYQVRDAVNGEGTTTYPLDLPENLATQESSLDLYLSASILGELPEKMAYLLSYPYGCIEQTMSRLMPLLVAKSGTGRISALLDDVDEDAMIQKGMRLLDTAQNPDGGMPWWRGGESDPFVSTYVAEYLVLAQEMGIDTRGIEVDLDRYLQILDADAGIEEQIYKAHGRVLFYTEADTPLDLEPITLSEDIDPYLAALALRVNDALGVEDPDINGLSYLVGKAVTQGDAVYWEDEDPDRYSNNYSTTAHVARIIMGVDPDNPVVPQALRYLQVSAPNPYYASTFATANAFHLVAEYYQQYEADAVSVPYTVTMGDRTVASGTITSSDQLLDPISIPLEPGMSDGAAVEIQTSGDDPLYWSFHQDYAVHTDTVEAKSEGITIQKTLSNLTEPGYSFARGDTVLVQLSIEGTTADMRHGIVEDSLPAGMVPVNTNLANESEETRETGRPEYTDTGAMISVYRFTEPSEVVEYTARVVAEGEYFVPPATVELMYQPEVNARSASDRIVISAEREYIGGEDAEGDKVDDASNRTGFWNYATLPFVVGFVGLIGIAAAVGGYFVYRKKMKSKKQGTHDSGKPPDKPSESDANAGSGRPKR